jgi:hypothetical protein
MRHFRNILSLGNGVEASNVAGASCRSDRFRIANHPAARLAHLLANGLPQRSLQATP